MEPRYEGTEGATVNLLAQPSKVRILHSPKKRCMNYYAVFLFIAYARNTTKKIGEWMIRTVKHADQREEEVPWMAPKGLDRGLEARGWTPRAVRRILHSPKNDTGNSVSFFYITA